MLNVRDPPPLGTCAAVTAYLTDGRTSTLLVYQSDLSRSRIYNDPLFLPDPAYANITIAGAKANFNLGIIGLALSPVRLQPSNNALHAQLI